MPCQTKNMQRPRKRIKTKYALLGIRHFPMTVIYTTIISFYIEIEVHYLLYESTISALMVHAFGPHQLIVTSGKKNILSHPEKKN